MATIYNLTWQTQVKELTAMNLNSFQSSTISVYCEPLRTINKDERGQDNLVQIMRHGQVKECAQGQRVHWESWHSNSSLSAPPSMPLTLRSASCLDNRVQKLYLVLSVLEMITIAFLCKISR